MISVQVGTGMIFKLTGWYVSLCKVKVMQDFYFHCLEWRNAKSYNRNFIKNHIDILPCCQRNIFSKCSL